MPSRHPTLAATMAKSGIGEDLQSVIGSIAEGCAKVAVALRTSIVQKARATNEFGDEVLSVDLISDNLIGTALRECPKVHGYASEEVPKLQTVDKNAGSGKYLVAFDPLDGSSIVDTNFSVGSIFGVWEGTEFIGKKVKDIQCSVVVVYGPRCVLMLAHRSIGVIEFLLVNDKSWHLATKTPFKIKPNAKIFAPGNLRASNDLQGYQDVVKNYVRTNTTLRYTGGMVPDVCQILIKGSGIFMTPKSDKYKVKLRVLYECGPIAFMIVCAGGVASDGKKDYLETVVESMDQRGPVVVGSKMDVENLVSKL